MSQNDNTPSTTPTKKEVSAPSSDNANPSSITERYKVLDKIGAGGMGRVYKARDLRLNKTVAVKLLLDNSFDQNQWLRFQREAKATSKLNHPNVVKILDFGQTENNQPFLVMDHIEGVPLNFYLEQHGPFEEEDALYLISELCSAMEHAHSHKIIHRDLKPSNIIVSSQNGQLKLMILDFGIAKQIDAAEDSKALTQAGEIIGSPRCLSPEQALGQKVDKRSDIYSLGCIAFEILTGKAVFRGETTLSIIDKHMNEKAPTLNSVTQTEFSDSMENIVAKALEKSPNNRFQSMSQFKQACQEDVKTKPVLNLNIEQQEEDKKSKTRTIVLISTLAIALLTISLIVVANLLVDPKPDEQKIVEKQDSEKEQELSFTAATKGEYDSYLNTIKEKTGYGIEDSVIVAKLDIAKRLIELQKEKPNAKHIWIMDCLVDDEIIEAIDTYKKVDYLKFDYCRLNSDKLPKYLKNQKLKLAKFIRTPITKEIAKALSQNKSLRTISVRSSDINDDLLKQIAQNKYLTEINLANNSKISIKGLKYFNPAQQMKIRYSKDNTNLTKKELFHLKNSNINFEKMSNESLLKW